LFGPVLLRGSTVWWLKSSFSLLYLSINAAAMRYVWKEVVVSRFAMDLLCNLNDDDFCGIADEADEEAGDDAAPDATVPAAAAAQAPWRVVKSACTAPARREAAATSLDQLLDADSRPHSRSRRQPAPTAVAGGTTGSPFPATARCSVAQLLAPCPEGASAGTAGAPQGPAALAEAEALKAALLRHSFAVLTDVPPAVLDLLCGAEAAAARFFCQDAVVKNRCRWAPGAHPGPAHLPDLPGLMHGCGYSTRALGKGQGCG
jgi:hypothetical protein